MKKCNIIGCDRNIKCRGLCSYHYTKTYENYLLKRYANIKSIITNDNKAFDVSFIEFKELLITKYRYDEVYQIYKKYNYDKKYSYKITYKDKDTITIDDLIINYNKYLELELFGTLKCNYCNTHKPKEEFYYSDKSGYTSYCKKCFNSTDRHLSITLRKSDNNNRAIVTYDMNHKLVKRYANIQEAVDDTGISAIKIRHCCGYTYTRLNDLFWFYEDLFSIEELTKRIKGIKKKNPYQYDKCFTVNIETGEITEYESWYSMNKVFNFNYNTMTAIYNGNLITGKGHIFFTKEISTDLVNKKLDRARNIPNNKGKKTKVIKPDGDAIMFRSIYAVAKYFNTYASRFNRVLGQDGIMTYKGHIITLVEEE